MSNVHYNVYLNGVIDLAATMTIKSEESARKQNDFLTILGGMIDESRPETWVYYMNLAGLYHSSNTMMTVRSSDTGEIIDFTKENLIEHRTTLIDHKYGSKKYFELLSRYPDQQELILGIVNPVDMETAIAAKDHSILHYDKSLVEEQEGNIIPLLQEWIFAVYKRWHVSNYNLFANLHEVGFLTVLYSNLPQCILNIRERNCHTEMVHSYHMREFLNSFGDLGKYFDYMTLKQKFFFYTNLRYLNKHSGQDGVFSLLTDRIFTDRNFPLEEFNIKHNPTEITENLYPVVEMHRRTLNGIRSEIGLEIQSVSQVLEKEDQLATKNSDFAEDNELYVLNATKRSKFSALETKVLESAVLDRGDEGSVPLEDMIINHWAYLAGLGKYKAMIVVNNPFTGEEISINAWDGFLLWIYAYGKHAGLEMDTIPVIGTWCVRKDVLPTHSQLRSIYDPITVPDYFIKEVLRDNVDSRTIISPITFLETVKVIHQRRVLHEDLYRYQQDGIVNVEVESLVSCLYENRDFVVGNETSYNAWLASKGIDTSEFTKPMFEELANDLYLKGTSYKPDTGRSLTAIHTAHVNMMRQLSSYSLQFVHESNQSELVLGNEKYLRSNTEYSFSEGYDHGILTPQTIVYEVGSGRLYKESIGSGIGVLSTFSWTNGFDRVEFSHDCQDDGKSVFEERANESVFVGGTVATNKTNLSDILINEVPTDYSIPGYLDLATIFTTNESSEYAGLTQVDLTELRAGN